MYELNFQHLVRKETGKCYGHDIKDRLGGLRLTFPLTPSTYSDSEYPWLELIIKECIAIESAKCE